MRDLSLSSLCLDDYSLYLSVSSVDDGEKDERKEHTKEGEREIGIHVDIDSSLTRNLLFLSLSH
jgi:hypothetical protein